MLSDMDCCVVILDDGTVSVVDCHVANDTRGAVADSGELHVPLTHLVQRC